MFDRALKNDDLLGYVGYLAEKEPTGAVTIVRGWAGPDKASLLIEGQAAYGKLVGEVSLRNVGGVWTVDEVLTECRRRSRGK